MRRPCDVNHLFRFVRRRCKASCDVGLTAAADKSTITTITREQMMKSVKSRKQRSATRLWGLGESAPGREAVTNKAANLSQLPRR